MLVFIAVKVGFIALYSICAPGNELAPMSMFVRNSIFSLNVNF